MKSIAIYCAALTTLVPSTAQAAEVFGGLLVHDVRTPLDLSGEEDGVDLMVGLRGGRMFGTPLQPYVFGALNSAGATSYAAVGVSARFGSRIYVRPGFGIAVHNGSAGPYDIPNNGRVELGSRVLFEPELGVGVRINQRLSAEATWIHMSHAQLAGKENPGIDNLGVRVNLKL